MASPLERIDAYCGAVPRAASRVEELGALRLFVKQGPGWPYYARPVPGGAAPAPGDLEAMRERQRELDVPEALEWIHDLVPELLERARRASSQVLGWLLITVSLPRLPAALTSVTLTIQPVGSVLLGVILLSEEPTALQLAGVACIIAALISIARRRAASCSSQARCSSGPPGRLRGVEVPQSQEVPDE